MAITKLEQLVLEWRAVDVRRHAAPSAQDANALFGVLELLHMRIFGLGEAGIDAFTQLLRDTDEQVRVDAAAALLPYRTTEAEAILREAANRSLTARYVLAEWGKGAPKSLPALEAAPVEDRIGDALVLYRIRLSGPERTRAQHAPKTVHLAGNVPQQVAHALAIARYDGEPTFYLLYLDEAGSVQSDSPHDSAEAAFRQAEFEFGLPPEEWAVTVRGAKLEASGE
jgi:hypothetical protein